MNGKQVISKLKSEGWQVDRVQGSHHLMTKEGHLRPVPVPVHGSKDLSKPLLKAIEKQTGVELL